MDDRTFSSAVETYSKLLTRKQKKN